MSDDAPRWPPLWPETDEATMRATSVALLSRRWAVASPQSAFPSAIDRVERHLADAFGRDHCVTTSNGSSAIVIALEALGIGPGDVVLVPATTWVACATAVLRVGARPSFIDAASDRPLMDAFDDAPDVAAILAVHLYASQLDVEALRRRHPRARVIEDVSHCATATDARGRILGGSGDISVVSLQATKVLTCGEGGAAFTDDRELAEKLSALRTDSRVRAEAPFGAVPLRAGTIQGANHALGEVPAALLDEQLARLDEQKRRRAEGAAQFVRLARDAGLDPVADEAALACGSFYGIVLRLGRDVESFDFERVREQSGVACGRVYAPVPHSPLYRPETIPAFADARHDAVWPHAEAWHRESIVLPHELFLARPARIRLLVDELCRATEPVRARAAVTVMREPAPETAVIALTHRHPRRRLRDALGSLVRQDHRGPIALHVVHHDEAPREELAGIARDAMTIDVAGFDVESLRDAPSIVRVSTLRQLALALVRSPRICFLDDDNVWLSDHLSSLHALQARSGVPAVHSWRQLVDDDGAPVFPDRFPWLPPGPLEREVYEVCVRNGLLDAGSNVVRDRASVPVGDADHGMVDMGEWLFDTALLRALGFDCDYSAAELERRVGEDDKLLARLRTLGVPTACTERASLIYALGSAFNVGRGGLDAAGES